MRTFIFTSRERQILENYLTEGSIEKIAVSKIIQQIKKHETLFEDVYLYLKVRKTMTT